jgi:hypothetical protein
MVQPEHHTSPRTRDNLTINEQEQILDFLTQLSYRKLDKTTFLDKLAPVYRILHAHGFPVRERLEEQAAGDVDAMLATYAGEHGAIRGDQALLDRIDAQEGKNRHEKCEPAEALRPLFELAEITYRGHGLVRESVFLPLMTKTLPAIRDAASVAYRGATRRETEERKHRKP